MRKYLCFFAWLFIGVSMASAQLTPEQQADMILSSARKAYAEKNFPVAATRFREFADRFPGHKDNNSARFWQALSQLALPLKDRNEGEILGTLQRLAASGTAVSGEAALAVCELDVATAPCAALRCLEPWMATDGPARAGALRLEKRGHLRARCGP